MMWTQQNGKWKEAPLHNGAIGLSAFIVCNGPSLAAIDVERLRGPGRVVVAVNNAAPKVRPDWWVGMDTPDCYDHSIFAGAYPKLVRPTLRDKFDGLPFVFTLDILENVAFYDGGEKDTFRWDSDTFRIALQLAVYLGCKDVFLFGVDLDTSKGDYADGNYLTDEQRAYNQKLYDTTFEFLAWHIENRPAVQIISASPGSRINELMPFFSLDSLVSSIEAKTPKGRKHGHVSESVT